jgi:peptide deformylase
MPTEEITLKKGPKAGTKKKPTRGEAEVPIVQNGAPILRELAQTVPVAEITSPKIQKVIADMKIALSGQDDGVAIAAPQIGQPLRIFVVSGAVLSHADPKYTGGDIVFINPEITKVSREKHDVEEGCLSVRWLYGKVKRAQKATIRGYDDTGKRVLRGASGLLAQVFQHETDHLDGILFIDKAHDVRDMPPEDEEDR